MSGETWMKCYLQTLSKKDVGALKATENSTIFKFGNVERVKADKFMRISSIEIDVWGCKSPLLIRENLIKKAGMRINVEIDSHNIQKKKARFFAYIFSILLHTTWKSHRERPWDKRNATQERNYCYGYKRTEW